MLTRLEKKSSLTPAFSARESGLGVYQKCWKRIWRHFSGLSSRKDDWGVVLEVPNESYALIRHLTCCSLKYHRLHPEYIPTRIEKLGTSYNLRILLILCDIVRCLASSPPPVEPCFQSEHREPIRELTKVIPGHSEEPSFLKKRISGMFNK